MNRATNGRYRLGVDIGGTFTDFVLMEQHTGRLLLGKTLTTSRDPSVAVVKGFERLMREHGLGAGQVDLIIHGTTLATNALIERKGARTGLITTAGFRDVLEIARERRYDAYDVMIDFPDPLVPRSLRLEVDERVDKDGNVAQPLAVDQVAAAVERLRREGVAAVAVCFLHSFRNPAHEVAVKEMIAARAPEIFVSISSEVVPEIREYERTSTTVVNAYVQPIMERYLNKLAGDLAALGYRRPVLMMLSSGGIASAQVAGRFPVRVIESGPAAGAIAVTHYSR
ncbi:MAG: hydantoinase/oxoprolinase family protein, partial [Armatimonadetes bacterium]|nr:hydantoinase/oxoprolinase family protein [Armatimonadota bacterium]